MTRIDRAVEAGIATGAKRDAVLKALAVLNEAVEADIKAIP